MKMMMKKGIQKIIILLLVLSIVLSGNMQSVKATAAVEGSTSGHVQGRKDGKQGAEGDLPGDEDEEQPDDEPSIEPVDSISLLQIADYSSAQVTLSWFSDGNNDGFLIYRKSKYDTEDRLLGTVPNTPYATHMFTDSKFKRGIKFTYKIVAYRMDEDGNVTEGASVSESIRVELPKTALASVSRNGKKVTVKWKQVKDVSGYEIYRKVGSASYQRVKTVSGADTVKWTADSASDTKKTSYKVRAFVKYLGNSVYGAFSAADSVYPAAVQKIVAKFKKLQKQYPTGKYWNHVNKFNYNSTTVTNTPCHHYTRDDISTCNHYNCPNGILGFQCYGFAWKMSDLIYGKSAKIKKFKSFAKCKMGDVIRYSGHSVIITEKHKNYVVVGECNYGNTCMILWGRKVYKSELSGASYSRRY